MEDHRQDKGGPDRQGRQNEPDCFQLISREDLASLSENRTQLSYLKGETYQKKSYSPIVWCNRDNWEELLIPWDVDESWMPVVDEFVKTGKYKPELRSM